MRQQKSSNVAEKNKATGEGAVEKIPAKKPWDHRYIKNA